MTPVASSAAMMIFRCIAFMSGCRVDRVFEVHDALRLGVGLGDAAPMPVPLVWEGLDVLENGDHTGTESNAEIGLPVNSVKDVERGRAKERDQGLGGSLHSPDRGVHS